MEERKCLMSCLVECPSTGHAHLLVTSFSTAGTILCLTPHMSGSSQPGEEESFTLRLVPPISPFPCLPHKSLTSISIHDNQSV